MENSMKKAFSILLIVFSAMMLIHCAYADIVRACDHGDVHRKTGCVGENGSGD